MRQTYTVMGTVASLDIPDCEDRAVFEKAFARLSEIDERFSPYKETSEVSLYNQGRLDKPSTEFLFVKKACKEWRGRTKGYFLDQIGDKYDPSGYVKGWAIAEAGKVIQKAGQGSFCLGIGGDILARGNKTWGIGIQDPQDKSKILNKLSISNGAIATSGTYERGFHIINPKTGHAAKHWLSISVLGPDMVEADCLATAAFAMEEAALDYLDKQDSYDYLAIDKNGRRFESPGFSS